MYRATAFVRRKILLAGIISTPDRTSLLGELSTKLLPFCNNEESHVPMYGSIRYKTPVQRQTAWLYYLMNIYDSNYWQNYIGLTWNHSDFFIHIKKCDKFVRIFIKVSSGASINFKEFEYCTCENFMIMLYY